VSEEPKSPSRWLRRFAWAACGLLWLEHVAILLNHYYGHWGLVWQSDHIPMWVAFLAPCLGATLMLGLAADDPDATRGLLFATLVCVLFVLAVLLLFPQQPDLAPPVHPDRPVDVSPREPRPMHSELPLIEGFAAFVAVGAWLLVTQLLRDIRQPPSE
jgi:hypothetical protein